MTEPNHQAADEAVNRATNADDGQSTTAQNNRRLELIRERLQLALNPKTLDVVDESHLHRGHAGARDGRGHFRVTIISAAFDQQSRLRRHRLIYQALGELMETDIHALAIEAFASEEL